MGSNVCAYNVYKSYILAQHIDMLSFIQSLYSFLNRNLIGAAPEYSDEGEDIPDIPDIRTKRVWDMRRGFAHVLFV